MGRIIAIDLGTSNSVVSVFDPISGKSECIYNNDGTALTASAVCFQHKDAPMIGNTARDVKLLYPETTCTLFKRLMGKEKCVKKIHGKDYSPQQLSAMVLKSLKADAEEYLGETVDEAVITVPAYFESNARAATKEAGMMAGFKKIHLLNEPSAGLLNADSLKNYASKTVMTFDLGGGTLDIVVASVTDNHIHELIINGDTACGGSDWSKAFMEYIKKQYLKGVNLNIEGCQELYNKVEKAKSDLSKKEEVTFSVMTTNGRMEVKVTRQEFEKCTKHLLEKAMNVFKQTKELIDQKGIRLDQIILIGGASRMTQIKKSILQIYPNMNIYEKDQDQAVAKGAAVYAYSLENKKTIHVHTEHEVTVKTLKSVTSRSYGISAIRNDGTEEVFNIIYQNASLPKTATREFYTRYEHQKSVKLEVYENVSSNETVALNDAVRLGVCYLSIEVDLPKDSPIKVRLQLDEDGTLHINGYEEKGHTEVTAVMKTEALLSKEEIKEQQEEIEDLFLNIS